MRRSAVLPLLLLVAAASGALLALAIASQLATRDRAEQWRGHTLEVIAETQRLTAAMATREEAAVRRTALADPSASEAYVAARQVVGESARRLRRLTADNPRQQARLAQLQGVIDQRNRLFDQAGGLRAGSPAALRLLTRAIDLAESARVLLRGVGAEETALLRTRTAAARAAERTVDRWGVALAAFTALLLAAAAVVALAAQRARHRQRLAEGLLAANRAADTARAEAADRDVLLRTIGEATPSLIYAKDAEGRMLYCNPACQAAIGRPLDQIIGRTELEWARDLRQAETIMANDRAVVAADKAIVFDEIFTNPAGVTRVFRSSKAPLRDAAGAVIGVIGVTADITEARAAEAALRESEARFRTLADTLPSLVFITTAEGGNIYTNATYQRYADLTADQLSGDGWVETVHPGDRERVNSAWSASVATGKPYEIEFRMRRRDGVHRWFAVRGAPVRDPDGAILQWVGNCTDIEDVIEARQALADANRRLEERVEARTADLNATLGSLRREIAEREAAEAQVRQMQKMEAVGQLTGGVAHDFNNMLAIIIGALGMAKRRLTSDPARAGELIGHAEDGATRAASLTARLLAFSRQQPLSPKPVDANRLVAAMSELLRRTLGEQIEVETVLAGGLWRTFADPDQLENALVNVCVNGRDAMPSGGKLTVETANGHLDDDYATQHAEVRAGQYVIVCVTDTGSGMPPEVAERAFDPFYTTKGTGRGTGLGLSQVYGFVKQSGGHVKIYSEPGAGTTVKIYLPRYDGEESSAEISMATAAAAPRGQADELVLLVEDEPRVRHTNTELLRELGYTVITAASGARALEQLAANPTICVLFTDVVMPQMDGRELAEKARERRPDLKVLFTTGYTRNAVVHNGMLDRGVALLGKPFTLDQLARKLRAVIDERP